MLTVFLDSNIIFSGLREYLRNKGQLRYYYLKKAEDKCKYFFSTFAIDDLLTGIKRAKHRKDKVFSMLSEEEIILALEGFFAYLHINVIESDMEKFQKNKKLYEKDIYVLDNEDRDDVVILADAIDCACKVFITNDKGFQAEKIQKDFGISVVSYNDFKV